MPEVIIVCLSNSGHYSDETYQMTKADYTRLVEIEHEYNYLDAASEQAQAEIKEIKERSILMEVAVIVNYE